MRGGRKRGAAQLNATKSAFTSSQVDAFKTQQLHKEQVYKTITSYIRSNLSERGCLYDNSTKHARDVGRMLHGDMMT